MSHSTPVDYISLMQQAEKARLMAYTPYSNFKVGAALLTEDGKVYLGCNIENAAYTPTNCAERTAFFKAVSEGERNFRCIAVVGGKEGEPAPFCAPCGVCRQVMAEFCTDEFEIILGTSSQYHVFKFTDILPYPFRPHDLEG